MVFLTKLIDFERESLRMSEVTLSRVERVLRASRRSLDSLWIFLSTTVELLRSLSAKLRVTCSFSSSLLQNSHSDRRATGSRCCSTDQILECAALLSRGPLSFFLFSSEMKSLFLWNLEGPAALQPIEPAFHLRALLVLFHSPISMHHLQPSDEEQR